MAAPRPAGLPGPPAWLLLSLLSLLCWSLTSHCGGTMALQPPSITVLRMPAESPRPGENVTVWCEAASGLPEVTLLYWLGNGSFVEKLSPDGAVSEGTTLEEPRGSGVTLRRDLRFSPLGARHLHTTFSCVVLSPLGVDSREVRWSPLGPAPAPAQSGVLG